MDSKKYELNKEDGLKIAKGAGIAIGSALVVYLTDIIPNIDWGVYGPVMVAVSGVLLNAVRKWLASN